MKKYYGNVFIDFDCIQCVTDETKYIMEIKPFGGSVSMKVKNEDPVTEICVYFGCSVLTMTGESAREFLEDHKEYVNELFPVNCGERQ